MQVLVLKVFGRMVGCQCIAWAALRRTKCPSTQALNSSSRRICASSLSDRQSTSKSSEISLGLLQNAAKSMPIEEFSPDRSSMNLMGNVLC